MERQHKKTRVSRWPIEAVAINDYYSVAATAEGQVIVSDSKTKEELFTYELRKKRGVISLALYDKFAFVASANHIEIIDIVRQRLLRTLGMQYGYNFTALAVSRARLVAASDQAGEAYVYMWNTQDIIKKDMDLAASLARTIPLNQRGTHIFRIAVSDDGVNIIAGTTQGRVFAIHSPIRLPRLNIRDIRISDRPITDVVIGNKLAYVASDAHIRVLQYHRNLEVIDTIASRQAGTYSAVALEEQKGLLAAIKSDRPDSGVVEIWNTKTLQLGEAIDIDEPVTEIAINGYDVMVGDYDGKVDYFRALWRGSMVHTMATFGREMGEQLGYTHGEQTFRNIARDFAKKSHGYKGGSRRRSRRQSQRKPRRRSKRSKRHSRRQSRRSQRHRSKTRRSKSRRRSKNRKQR